MSLPERFKNYLTSDFPSQRMLAEALAIAVEAIEKVRGYNIMSDPYSRDTSGIMEEALRRIEALGK